MGKRPDAMQKGRDPVKTEFQGTDGHVLVVGFYPVVVVTWYSNIYV